MHFERSLGIIWHVSGMAHGPPQIKIPATHHAVHSYFCLIQQTMSLEVKAMPLRFAGEYMRRLTSRGWRSNLALVITIFFGAGFMLWHITRETEDVLDKIHHAGMTVPPSTAPVHAPSIPTFREVPDSGVMLILGADKSGA